jgi:hypothetical protein
MLGDFILILKYIVCFSALSWFFISIMYAEFNISEWEEEATGVFVRLFGIIVFIAFLSFLYMTCNTNFK